MLQLNSKFSFHFEILKNFEILDCFKTLIFSFFDKTMGVHLTRKFSKLVCLISLPYICLHSKGGLTKRRGKNFSFGRPGKKIITTIQSYTNNRTEINKQDDNINILYSNTYGDHHIQQSTLF
jgi:hypothetical protein